MSTIVAIKVIWYKGCRKYPKSLYQTNWRNGKPILFWTTLQSKYILTSEKKSKIVYYLLHPNLSMEIESMLSDKRGSLCKIHHVFSDHLGSLCYNSFRWWSSRLFNLMVCTKYWPIRTIKLLNLHKPVSQGNVSIRDKLHGI